MGVPIVYRKSAESSTASYDYMDLTTGVGYKTYYISAGNVSGATVYFLTPDVIRGTLTGLSLTVDNSFGLEGDYDFDLTFKNTAIIEGDAIFNTTVGQATDTTLYLTINVYHVASDGTTETLIGTQTTTARNNTSGSTTQYTEKFKVSLTKKRFSKSEKLRVNYKVYAGKGSPGSAVVSLYTDPSDTTNVNKVSIPFRIDL